MKFILYSLLFTVSTFAHSSACDKYKVKQDYINHFDCVSELAESGYAPSQLILGVAYEFGEGVQQNLNMAKHYYGLACDKGHQKGCTNYARLNEQSIK
ncbi:tetratricopeptide repeat protein [Mannheimia pernigra]|uniref:tetratricopeptide repeat protein n=1 Tax=Mannheimia pernigra TaxID=111844 RepID=UPI00159F47D7|nr:sel1 repeat family protein [Mannheimia pernigra]QLB43880.1 sel1 repeat family protein [Mannheimia pernigra]